LETTSYGEQRKTSIKTSILPNLFILDQYESESGNVS